MNKPIKCKCGKMISRPKRNKSGLCYSCTMNHIQKSRGNKSKEEKEDA